MTNEELNKWVENSHYYEHDECVVLLRQQADRIDKLMTIAEDYQMLIVKLKENSHPVKQLSKYEISEIVDEIFGVQPSDDMTYFYDFYNAIIKEITE